jgi:hypothetical protein
MNACALPSKNLVPDANGSPRLTPMTLRIEQREYLAQRQPGYPNCHHGCRNPNHQIVFDTASLHCINAVG